MRLVYPELDTVLTTEEPGVQTLIIEEPVFLRTFLRDISAQTEGFDGRAVLSENNRILEFSRFAELIDDPLHFELNRKTLLTKVAAALEREAAESEHLEETAAVLRDAELWLDSLAFEFPCDIEYTKLTASALIRAVGVSLRDDYEDLLERLIDYMELVREFDRDRLFITVNLRCFFSDEETALFTETALSHGYRLLMVESIDAPRLPGERRVTVDRDLCEF